MIRRWRLKKAHARFLDSCRSLNEDRGYWEKAGSVRRWLLQAFVPVPLMGLHPDGMRLLDALRWLEEHCSTLPVTEDVIKKYHVLISGSAVSDAGEYRKHKTSILGSEIARPAPDKIPALMKQLEIKLRQEELDAATTADASSIFRRAAVVHQRLAFIHPFRDGNGRVARLVMNHFLRRHKCGYSIFPPISESKAHFDALEEAHRGNLDPLVTFLRSCMFKV